MQQVLEEVLEGILGKVLDVVHLKEVFERVLVATLGEGLKEAPEGVDLLLLHPLCGNQEEEDDDKEEEEEEESKKEGAVKERQKEEHTF